MVDPTQAFSGARFFGGRQEDKKAPERLRLFAEHLEDDERVAFVLPCRNSTLLLTDRRLLDLKPQLVSHGAWNVKWWDLVDGVVKRCGDKPGWHWLHARLQSLRDDTEVPRNCKGFRKWADDVARYSFYSGRVLLGPQSPGSQSRA